MSFERTEWVWHNGQQVFWDEAKIHSSAFGLHYGTGVFEGIRAYETVEGPVIFRLREHLDRLSASAKVYGIEIPYSREQLTEAISDNISFNDFKNCYIRPIAYFDSGGLGIRAICPVSVTIIAWEWANAINAEKKARGLRVTVSPWKKFHSSMLPTTAKSTGQYLNSILAVREAAMRGYDEAIMLDVNGNLAEGAVENIFLVRNGKVLTNDEKSSILLGITRASVIEIARNLGFEVEIRALSLDDLFEADEAFLTGTAIEIAPIREVDGRIIGEGRSRPITEMIQKTFFEIVAGRSPKYRPWLHPVSSTVGVGAIA
ncbi:MAG: branched-chain amino acid transaminase [Acidobacteria bacterium]|nr:branched-chain amino acid transaminase [Acidobacteriota bacterium]